MNSYSVVLCSLTNDCSKLFDLLLEAGGSIRPPDTGPIYGFSKDTIGVTVLFEYQCGLNLDDVYKLFLGLIKVIELPILTCCIVNNKGRLLTLHSFVKRLSAKKKIKKHNHLRLLPNNENEENPTNEV